MTQRPIKFRAWDEGNKVMHADFQFIKSGDAGNDWIIFISDKYPLTKHETNPFTNPSPYFSQQLKVMQWTGLLDKDGKEIYEGDIVKNDVGEIAEVKWEVPEFLAMIGSEAKGFWNILTFPSTLGIIGNIYENKDLLK